MKVRIMPCVIECLACHTAACKAVHKMPRVVAIIFFSRRSTTYEKHNVNVAFGTRRRSVCKNIRGNWQETFLTICRDMYHFKQKLLLKNVFEAVVRVSKSMLVTSSLSVIFPRQQNISCGK